MKEILEARIRVLEKAKWSLQLQAVENELCRRDILYWFNNYAYTDKNNGLYWANFPDVLPFIPYPFQEDMITNIWNGIITGESIFLEKSRQMWASWVIMGILVYGFIFHNHKYLVLSQKQDDVDKLWDMKSLFEKARFMINNLPKWMLPKGFDKRAGSDNNKYMNMSRPDGTGSITGESANPNASRWGTYNAILADEFAFMSNASTINKAMASASPCRIYTSTPNGKGNEHYRMKLMAQATIDKNGVETPAALKWLRYHWSCHPLYDQERYNKKTAAMDKVTIAQELEIDYDTSVQGRVYDEFPKEATTVIYDENKPLYVAIDNSHGWEDPNAVIIIQPNGAYWNIIDSVEFRSTPIDIACFLACQPKMVLTDPMSEFFNRYKDYDWKRATFISDPYDTLSAMGNSTILDDYKKMWINLMIPNERSKQEQILKTRTNIYKFRYNSNCGEVANAMLNARYPTRKEDSNSTKAFTLPVHDWTSHYRTAMEYFVTYICENPPYDWWPMIAVDTRPYKDHLWRMIYPKTSWL